MESFSRYLPIDDALFASPLFLTSAGHAVIPPEADYPPPGHPDLYQFDWREGRVLPEFSLLWLEKGSGVWETRGHSHPIRAGQVGHVISGHWHRYRPDREVGWSEYWVQFNGRLAHELQEAGLFSLENPVRTPLHPRRFARQFLDFLQDIASPDFLNSNSEGLRVAGLLGLLGESASGAREPAHGLMEKARQHIWSHSHGPLNVKAVAKHLRVSRRTLERAFSNGDSPTVLGEITRCRLNRAERLLRETRLSIKQIVSLAGFGTTEQMRLHFHARHGQSPAEYRQVNL